MRIKIDNFPAYTFLVIMPRIRCHGMAAPGTPNYQESTLEPG